ncbi:MAG: HAD family hydrolase [Candidatus Shapirobacteria bacterium]|jgi:HAD superfamily hydrolase (TIGR01549 family)
MIPWITKIVTKFIIWDLDGTLYQNKILGQKIKDHFLTSLQKTLPNVTEEEFDQLTKKYSSWSAVLGHFTNRSEFDVLDDFDKAVGRSKFLDYDPKIVEFIEVKLSSYRHLILTNSGIDEAKKCLHKIGFNPKTFEKIFARDTIKMLKPDPNIYPIIKQYTQCPNFRHLFIGDSLAHDVIPPKKLGFNALPIWEVIDLTKSN